MKANPSFCQTPGYLDIAHAATWACVSQKTIQRWLKHGLLYFQEGPKTKILIRCGDIEKFLHPRQVPQSNLETMVEETLRSLQ